MQGKLDSLCDFFSFVVMVHIFVIKRWSVALKSHQEAQRVILGGAGWSKISSTPRAGPERPPLMSTWPDSGH